jgi:flagellar M-ring protein FliF
MNAPLNYWNRLHPGSRIGFVAGAVLILVLTAWLAFMTLRPHYQVLFSRLAQSDAAAAVEQLKRLKVPYRIVGDGTTIEVPADQVYETRLRLMSSGTPFAGAVGFEIFDKQGLGATEESQRVSYQRALQGELSRTIGALEDVKQARVHLVLPESTLFKRDRQEARAGVFLTLQPGATLTHAQILGIQRLVAAAVAALDPAKVVVTDQRGITLSGADSLSREGAEATGSSEARLEMKRDVEDAITRKVAKLLDSTYGPGQAIVSVDAQLDFDEIHRTVQGLLPVEWAQGERGAAIVRKRQVTSGASSSSSAKSAEKDSPQPPANSTTEVEYQYGHSVEQVIAAPGTIARLSIGILVPGELSAEKQERITALVRAAAGVREGRGDTIVVQPIEELSAHVPAAPAAASTAAPVPAVPVPQASVPSQAPKGSPMAWTNTTVWLPLVLLVILAAAWLYSRQSSPEPLRVAGPLSSEERQQLLLEIQEVLDGQGSPGHPGTRSRIGPNQRPVA